ncbi:MAG TPA: non-ribosomal peptide synthetase [Bryobacteraceae bacterium]|nr:non-ribosomal peptide synthetase [Bryobacteraceae bacterium]
MIAAQKADALAIAAPAFRMSYGQLNERAAGFAQGLRLLGVATDRPVAVFANRTPAGIIGALAVLKAGAGYVPLDPAHPEARNEYILRDVGAPFVLAERSIAGLVPKGAWKVIPIDDAPLFFSKPMEPTAPPAPNHLAYVCYTSGPAGHPIGVEISHGSLLNLVRWHQRVFKVEAADNAAQLAGPALDAAAWEIWPYLTAGASLHFPEEGSTRTAALMRAWLCDEYVTIALAPTPMAEQLISLDWPSSAALRVLLTTGEALKYHPPAGLPFVLVNNYGQAETTIVATSALLSPRSNPLELPPIGLAIDHTSVAILDESLRPVPDGRSGELCIGGAGLARGYLNQPQLTARKFVTAPSGARLFRTGDLARRLPNGQIAFLGRRDGPIKVRGCRVEPAEIECLLNSHAAVRESAVAVRENGTGGRCLIAYAEPAEGGEVTAEDLERFLCLHLPEAMLPDSIEIMDELPRTPDGKVDRGALPAAQTGSEMAVRPSVAVRLAGLMASVLAVDAVALDDNFFRRGGHPLLGAILIDRVHQTFGVTLSPQQLFESPTAGGLAAEIERAAQLARK